MQILAVAAVAAGIVHTCAVRSDAQLVCFGHNTHDGRCDAPPQALFILVQCSQMLSSSASDTRRMMDRHWSGSCSAGRWSVRLRWKESCSFSQFGTSFDSLSGQCAHLCSAGRGLARLLCIQLEWAVCRRSRFGTSFVGHWHTCCAEARSLW